MYFNTMCDFMIEDYKKSHKEEVSTSFQFRPAKPEELVDPQAVHPEYGLPVKTVTEIKNNAYKILRGTVQADILKEVQAQNEVRSPFFFL
jgi:methylmalonyl-CoA mutase N-terminal domain/subunit